MVVLCGPGPVLVDLLVPRGKVVLHGIGRAPNIKALCSHRTLLRTACTDGGTHNHKLLVAGTHSPSQCVAAVHEEPTAMGQAPPSAEFVGSDNTDEGQQLITVEGKAGAVLLPRMSPLAPSAIGESEPAATAACWGIGVVAPLLVGRRPGPREALRRGLVGSRRRQPSGMHRPHGRPARGPRADPVARAQSGVPSPHASGRWSRAASCGDGS